jgi:hypothetical protein
MSMQRIIFMIALGFLSFLAHNGFLYEEKPSSPVYVKANKAAAGKRYNPDKAFYPLFFGSSFMIPAERLMGSE